MALITVYYDGSCPLCRKEIAFYQRCKGADRIDWTDVSAAGALSLEDGLTCEAAMARFHVRGSDDHLYS